MQRRLHGFTLVELLFVVSGLTIIATIAIVSWNGAVQSSRDHMREQDVRLWSNSFTTYAGRYYVYPVVPSSNTTITVCLGSPTYFANYNNRCGQYNNSTSTKYADAGSSSNSQGLVTELAKIGNVPTNGGPMINGSSSSTNIIGPVVYITRSGSGPYTLDARFVNFFQGNCPNGFTADTSNALSNGTSGVTACQLSLPSLSYNG